MNIKILKTTKKVQTQAYNQVSCSERSFGQVSPTCFQHLRAPYLLYRVNDLRIKMQFSLPGYKHQLQLYYGCLNHCFNYSCSSLSCFFLFVTSDSSPGPKNSGRTNYVTSFSTSALHQTIGTGETVAESSGLCENPGC